MKSPKLLNSRARSRRIHAFIELLLSRQDEALKGKPLPCRRAWEILESRFGREHPEVAAACVALGNLAAVRQQWEEASDWFGRGLQTFEVGEHDKRL